MDASYPVDALPVGATLDYDRYEIYSILGRGAFGITYLANDHLGREVAIKEFFPTGYVGRDQSSSVYATIGEQGDIFSNGLKKFLGEAKTVARFKHPNLVHILTYFEQNGTGYITMDYEPGQDLKTYLRDHQVSEQYLITLFTSICDGLSLLHQEGYIHRDIKAANIRIRNDGSPVLLDFGAARDIFSSRPDQLTLIYTQSYAPYEQINPGWGKQGAWTDIYALAVTLYYAVSKKMPADAQARASAFMNKEPDPYEPLLADNYKRFSPEFLAAIDKAMNFDPRKRPASVSEWTRQLASKDSDTYVLESAPPTHSQNPENAETIASPSSAASNEFAVISPGKTMDNRSINSRKTGGMKLWRIAKILVTLSIAAIGIGGAAWYLYQTYAPSLSIREPDRGSIGGETQSSIFLTTNRGEQPLYRQGEEIKILISSDKDLYVYCFYQEENANLYRMFPNADRPDAYLNAGITVIIPSVSNSLEAGGPGQDLFQCFGTSTDISGRLANRLGDDGGMQPIAAITLTGIRDFIETQSAENTVEIADISIAIE